MNNPNHLVIDLFNVYPEYLLSTQQDLIHYIREIIKICKMTPKGYPTVSHFIDKEYGHSAYTISQHLCESLIDLHTYPESRAIYISLFSCKPFDVDKFIQFTLNYFSPEIKYIYRVPRASNKNVKELRERIPPDYNN